MGSGVLQLYIPEFLDTKNGFPPTRLSIFFPTPSHPSLKCGRNLETPQIHSPVDALKLKGPVNVPLNCPPDPVLMF